MYIQIIAEIHIEKEKEKREKESSIERYEDDEWEEQRER